jgi:hypothetical protein
MGKEFRARPGALHALARVPSFPALPCAAMASGIAREKSAFAGSPQVIGYRKNVL